MLTTADDILHTKSRRRRREVGEGRVNSGNCVALAGAAWEILSSAEEGENQFSQTPSRAIRTGLGENQKDKTKSLTLIFIYLTSI